MGLRIATLLCAFLPYLTVSCGGDNPGPESLGIPFDSVTPSSGPPGTIITISGVLIPSPPESLVVRIGETALPVVSRIADDIIVACPQLRPGNHDIYLEHFAADRTFVTSFSVTEPEPTGLPAGEVTQGVVTSLVSISEVTGVIIETMNMQDLITDAEYTSFLGTIAAVEEVYEGLPDLVAQLPDSEKTTLDQHLKASGLADLLVPPGGLCGAALDVKALRSGFASRGEYAAFYCLVFGDNVSWMLSAVHPVLKAVNVGLAFATSGLSLAIVTAVTYGFSSIDNVIEGYIPTDLYELEMQCSPTQGSALRVSGTASARYLGRFRTQSHPVGASVSIVVEGIMGFMPAAEVEKLIFDIGGMIGVEALENHLSSQQTVVLDSSIPVDINYYTKTGSEVVDLTTQRLPGILAKIPLSRIMAYANITLPELNGEPVRIASSLVSLSPDRQFLTGISPGVVGPSEITLRAWVMNPKCEGQNAYWWTWACLGFEEPEYLEPDAYTKPTIQVEAYGNTWVIKADGTGDFPTIRDAVAAAQDGDVIVLTEGTYIGEGNYGITYQGKGIAISSQSGDPKTCTIDCRHLGRWLYIGPSNGKESLVEGLTILDGLT